MALAFFWVLFNIKPTQLGDGGTAPFWLLVQWVESSIFIWSQCHLRFGKPRL